MTKQGIGRQETRLQTICSLITPADFFVDIGSDHGYIAAYAASICKRVLATDISEKCLIKAQKNISAKNVEFAVGDGLSVLQEDADLIAICGMGGHTIVDILKGYDGKAQLIIQPQSDIPYVREFLSSLGYVILHDIFVKERGKYYSVIKAKRGIENLSPLQIVFGKFYKEKNPIFKNCLIKTKAKFKSYAKTEKNIEFLKMIDEVLKWQE